MAEYFFAHLEGQCFLFLKQLLDNSFAAAQTLHFRYFLSFIEPGSSLGVALYCQELVVLDKSTILTDLPLSAHHHTRSTPIFLHR